MAAATENIKPDVDFMKQISSLSGGSLKKCFQCGGCSVVCSLSPDKAPFPRKEMIWAQWGLKDRLLKDPDIWLCHNCNDCSTYCPRGAKPGDVLSAVRNLSILHFALPAFMERAVSRLGYLLAALVLLVVLYFLPIAAHARLAFAVGTGLALLVAAIGGFRFWNSITRSQPAAEAKQGFIRSFISALGEILGHSGFRQCDANRGNYYGHLLTLYGSILLLLGHIIPIHRQAGLSPGLTDTVNMLAILGALAVFCGLTLTIYRRLFKKGQAGGGTYFDWLFIGLFYLTIITGVAAKLTIGVHFRAFGLPSLPGITTAATSTFFPVLYPVHLAFIFALLLYLPFSKFAHLFYRTLAITYAKQMGREPSPGLGKTESSLSQLPHFEVATFFQSSLPRSSKP